MIDVVADILIVLEVACALVILIRAKLSIGLQIVSS